MPIPIVTILIPVMATPLEARALINSCDQAFETGDCVANEEKPEDGSLLAKLEWDTDTRVRIILEVPADQTSKAQHSELGVEFMPQDAPLERYRALGFTIGSLASSYFEPLDETTPPKPKPAPPPPVKRSQPELSEVTKEPPASITPPIVDPVDEPDLSRAVERAATAAVNAAFLAGSGFESPRFGGMLGVWYTLAAPWTVGVSASYATQPRIADAIPGGAKESVSAEYFTGSVSLGPRWQARSLEASVVIVGGVNYISLSSQATGKGHASPVFAGGVGAELRWLSPNIEPFVAAQSTWGRPIDVSFQGAPAGTEGPIRGAVQVGISIPIGRPAKPVNP